MLSSAAASLDQSPDQWPFSQCAITDSVLPHVGFWLYPCIDEVLGVNTGRQCYLMEGPGGCEVIEGALCVPPAGS